jgi:RNA polymerase sigma-70 factor (sigma-E family)
MAHREADRNVPPTTDEGFVQWAAVRRGRLRRTAYLMCGDWAAADDLVQDALLRVYLKWRRIAGGNPDAYPRRALTSAFVDDRRRPWRRERPTETLPEAAVGGAEVRIQETPMAAALRQVPPGQRAVLVLRYWEDLSLEQTADALDCSVGNVKAQASRGLVRLRELLSGAEDLGPGGVPMSVQEVLP